MMALRLAGLRVPFGDAPGLAPVSLELEPGARLAIVGASGAGKTSLLRAIAGLAPVTGGTVEIEGRDVTSLPPERRGAVYLHQNPVLFPHLDVFENVAFPLRVRNATDPDVREHVARALAAVRLDGLATRRPRSLSGGQRHRVALARAIAARPAVLLLDEPLSALDPSLRDEVRAAIRSAHEQERSALVLVTHDIDEAGLLADRIAVLLEHRIAQIDRPADLFARPASLAVARLLGFANQLPGRVREDGAFDSPLGVIPAPPPLGGPGPAVAVFHPEALRLAADGVPATVREIRYRLRGATALIDRAGHPLHVALRAHQIPAPGEKVRVRVEPSAVVVLPADPAP